MEVLTLEDLAEIQAQRTADVGMHLTEFLHLSGDASLAALMREAERWVPGNSAVDWEIALRSIVTWGRDHGDLVSAGTHVRLLPSWGVGPFHEKTDGHSESWAVRLHGAVNHDQLTSRSVEIQVRSVVDGSGLGVGRVVLARGTNREELLRLLTEAGMRVQQWPVAATRLLRREPPDERLLEPPSGEIQYASLHKEFGKFSWLATPPTTDQERWVTRVTADDERRTRLYFLSRGRQFLCQVSWAEAVAQIWRMQQRMRLSGGIPVAIEEILLPSPTGIEFACQTVPPRLEQCLYPYDESGDVGWGRKRFDIPESLRQTVADLVIQFLEALRSA